MTSVVTTKPGSDSKPGSDEELALRAQQGCSASFEQLVRRLQVPLLGFLRRWVSREDAEDLVQETFVRAYRNLHRYNPNWRFRTWLYTVSRRLSINQQRRKRPVADSQRVESATGDTPTPLRIVVREESRRDLWEAARRVLTERQVAALWLYYVEDMPVKQIARVLGRTNGAVKATLFRARRKMLPLMRELYPDLAVLDRRPTRASKVLSGQTTAECSHG